MGQDQSRKSHQAWPAIIAAVALALAASPAVAQHAAAGHSAAGGITKARPMPGRSFASPMRSAPMHSGQRFEGVRANSFGASSALSPSWELPRYVTPHWELGPNLQRPPNPVRGNRIPRRGARFGVGYVGLPYVGLPYYGGPMAFGNAWDWNADSDSEEQAAPAAPERPEYEPQPGPYAEAPYDQGYPPPPPPGYDQEGFPIREQNNAAQDNAAQNDGLDHPPVTLVFNNGRPPEKVSSYVLTGSSIFVAEPGHQRKIPIADLDLPATVKQNREAGVDFELPGANR